MCNSHELGVMPQLQSIEWAPRGKGNRRPSQHAPSLYQPMSPSSGYLVQAGDAPLQNLRNCNGLVNRPSECFDRNAVGSLFRQQ